MIMTADDDGRRRSEENNSSSVGADNRDRRRRALRQQQHEKRRKEGVLMRVPPAAARRKFRQGKRRNESTIVAGRGGKRKKQWARISSATARDVEELFLPLSANSAAAGHLLSLRCSCQTTLRTRLPSQTTDPRSIQSAVKSAMSLHHMHTPATRNCKVLGTKTLGACGEVAPPHR